MNTRFCFKQLFFFNWIHFTLGPFSPSIISLHIFISFLSLCNFKKVDYNETNTKARGLRQSSWSRFQFQEIVAFGQPVMPIHVYELLVLPLYHHSRVWPADYKQRSFCWFWRGFLFVCFWPLLALFRDFPALCMGSLLAVLMGSFWANDQTWAFHIQSTHSLLIYLPLLQPLRSSFISTTTPTKMLHLMVHQSCWDPWMAPHSTWGTT